MNTTATLNAWFVSQGVEPRWQPCPGKSAAEIVRTLSVSADRVLAPQLLESQQRAVMLAMVPASRALEIPRIDALLRRTFHVADSRRSGQVFGDADPDMVSPFADAYWLPALVDRSLLELPEIYFRAGIEGWVGRLDGDAFRRLVGAHPKVVISAQRSYSLFSVATIDQPPASLVSPEQAVQKLYRLPPLPGMALRVVELVRNPAANLNDLVDLIELDPALTAQIMRVAASAHFGYRGRLASVRDAITRVLGFELVGHIALGIAATKAFIIPREGPCGLRAYWRHALSSAVLSQLIARKLRDPQRFPPDTAYLCGLLHNIGVLLWGHLFPADFHRMNQYLASHKEWSLPDYEAAVRASANASPLWPLGHAELGALLLGTWQLPAPVVAVARDHHAQGEHHSEPLVAVVQLANKWLASAGVGDMPASTMQSDLAGQLGLSARDVEDMLATIASLQGDIGDLAATLAA